MPLIHSGPAWTPPNTTSGGTGAATTETDLQSVIIPAAMLATKYIVRISAGGAITGSAGNKTINAYFGALGIISSAAFNTTGGWSIDAVVVVTGASAQISVARIIVGSNAILPVASKQAPTEAISGAITVKTTGQTVNSADEVTGDLLIVEVIPA